MRMRMRIGLGLSLRREQYRWYPGARRLWRSDIDLKGTWGSHINRASKNNKDPNDALSKMFPECLRAFIGVISFQPVSV